MDHSAFQGPFYLPWNEAWRKSRGFIWREIQLNTPEVHPMPRIHSRCRYAYWVNIICNCPLRSRGVIRYGASRLLIDRHWALVIYPVTDTTQGKAKMFSVLSPFKSKVNVDKRVKHKDSYPQNNDLRVSAVMWISAKTTMGQAESVNQGPIQRTLAWWRHPVSQYGHKLCGFNKWKHNEGTGIR